MLRLSRPITGLIAVAAVLTALTAWDRWAGTGDESPIAGSPGWQPPGGAATPRHDAALLADVSARSHRLQEVCDEVRAGRLGLLDAAARVRDIQTASPFFPLAQFREAHPGDSDDERFCHMLILLVTPLPVTPGQTDPVVARLEAELEEHRKHGPIRLP